MKILMKNINRLIAFIYLLALSACSNDISVKPSGGDSGGSNNETLKGDRKEHATPTDDSKKKPKDPNDPEYSGTAPSYLKKANLQRLTAQQYENSIKDIFELNSLPALSLPADEKVEAAYSTFYPNQVVTGIADVTNYFNASLTLANHLVDNKANIATIKDCPGASFNNSCLQALVHALGLRLFRQELTDAEVTTLINNVKSKLTNVASEGDKGLRILLATLLNSPRFIYQSFYGESGKTATSELTSYEIVAKLSLLLHEKNPSLELLEKAKQGLPKKPDELKKIVQEMLNSEAASGFLVKFFAEYLHISQLSDTSYPGANWKNLFPLYMQEFELNLKRILFDENLDIRELYHGKTILLNKELAAIYGLNPPSGTNFEPVDLADSHRSGIVTSGAVMAGNSTTYLGNATHRGIFISAKFLCVKMSEPPESLQDQIDNFTSLPPVDTARQQVNAISSNAACAACHNVFDPIGMLFDGFTSLGLKDTNNPLDNKATVQGKEYQGIQQYLEDQKDNLSITQCLIKNFTEFMNGQYFSDSLTQDSAQYLALQLKSKEYRFKEFFIELLASKYFIMVGQAN
ncbi:MAG: DUF1592 domain-containing protein [Oligoflexales bacterium]|nr:DUF1592 domain-containing protein [Oligoflexales bacterium]